MLKIGEFSKLAKVTIKALRYYDKLGLLKPALVDSENSYRYYKEEQLETITQILTYKNLGISCTDIYEILNSKKPKDKILLSRKQQLLNMKENITKQVEEIEKLLQTYNQNPKPQIINIPSQTVFYCQSYIKDIDHIKTFIRDSVDEFHRTNPDIEFSLPDYCCVIYPDENYRESDILIEYAQSVTRQGINTPTVKFKILEPVTAVSITHKGGYENLRDSYVRAMNFALNNGFSLYGNPRERYIDGAWNKKSKAEWLTEIQIPIIPKGDKNL